MDVKDFKKIKKHIYGKLQSVKVCFPSGFHDVALQEITDILNHRWFAESSSHEIISSHKSIIIHSITMFAVVELMMRGQTFTDVRLIISQSKVHGNASFQKKCELIPWEYYLNSSMNIYIKVNSVASRAFHEGALKNILADILKPRVKSVGDKEAVPSTGLYVDLHKDKLMISVSLAGEALYKRGYRQLLQAKAPLREDMAAACIKKAFMFIRKNVPDFDVQQLVVPFSGTGTFVFEFIQHAISFSSALFSRSYALQDMPLYRASHYQFILKKALEHVAAKKIEITCIDSSQEANQVLNENIIEFNRAMAKTHFSTWAPKIVEADFITMSMDHVMGDVFIAMNPPYGIRLGKESQSVGLYKKIAEKLNELSQKKGTRIAGFILCPSEGTWSIFLKTLHSRRHETYHFIQGGLDVRVCQFLL